MNNGRETIIFESECDGKSLSNPRGVNYGWNTKRNIEDDRVNRSHFFSSAHEKISLYERKNGMRTIFFILALQTF